MATLSDPPRESFHISQLLYDTRYRSITIQVIAFILIVAAFVFLARNVVINLSALGKDFDFGFLGSRAGYDINQRLIEYSNESTHGRAALVGILNTLLVAFLGCIVATILGVIAGVLRLSKNWIVSRLMSVYVEGFRNIPLLLWIIVIFAVMTESTPSPRDFRGADPEASMLLGESVAITNRGIFIPAPVWGDGAFLLVSVFIVSLAGIWAFRRFARKRQEATGAILPVFWVSLGLFFVPVLVVYFAYSAAISRDQYPLLAVGAEQGMTLESYVEANGNPSICALPSTAGVNLSSALREIGQRANIVRVSTEAELLEAVQSGDCILAAVSPTVAASFPGTVEGVEMAALTDTVDRGRPLQFERPQLAGFNFEGGVQLRNSLIALWFALSLYTGAFIAEIVRAGILSVSRGQTEAAFALGLRPNRTMNLVILPQALRVIIPPLISQYLNLTKNSSLAIAVGYMDVRATLGGITINQTGRELEGILLMGLFYLALSLLISAVMNLYNNSVKLQER
ncbi:ABC transporter permease subunit [Rhodobacteraceae bacterium N5(2021)]|uniref:ABC transporter permease subunit n=1 Tax=Gymnodinialimonas phycosphaerae TaxID=2841589 RepID=A0A975TU99_9RHOB|nr:ABC transporter permease subunit [Gymnodinialimonas phycosphaerae]MBY4894707.1 ABC transporter permease subunit [Gymnodinialimonas phycosphaerae]